MPGACIDTHRAPGLLHRLRNRLANRLAIWRLRNRIAELRAATDIGREMIRSDMALIERQEQQIAALKGELLQRGGLTTCEKS